MSTKRDFWRMLRALVDELQQEGESDYERALGLSAWLLQMTPDERAARLDDLEAVTSALIELVEGNGGFESASCNGNK